MAINKDMLHAQTHSLFEKAGEVLDGVSKLKERIAELEKEKGLGDNKDAKISIKYPVFRNDWSHYKRYFICLGRCFPKKGESRTSWGLELIKDDAGNWQIEANAKYYSDDLGKERMPRIGSINLASLILDEIKKLDP